MSDTHNMTTGGTPASRTKAPAWWIVCSREIRDLWIGGKALQLVLFYTVLLGVYAFFLASNAEVNLLPVREMIQEVAKAAIVGCLLMSMLVGADSVAGDRERGTLEGLLLTPATRRQIVFGKYVAAMSPIPVALLITIPYVWVLCKGNPVFGPTLLWLAVLAGLLVPALAAMGMLASIWSNSTKVSMAVSFALFLLMLLPSEIMRPGKIMTAAELRKALVFQSINPIDAMTKFLGRVLVLDMPPGEHWFLLTTPIAMGAVTLVLLFFVAGPRLRLESTVGLRLRALWTRPTRPPARRRRDVVAVPPDAEPQRDALPVPSAPVARLRAVALPRPGSSRPAAPTWWLVFTRELRDLWIGGKALNFTIAYMVLVGGYAYWQARDSAVSLVPPKEMVFELLKFALMAAVFMGLILGADSLSGERERSTLESLLLTPTRRMQIIVGKFLAAASMWPAAAIVMVPFAYSLAQGDEVFGQAVLWGAIVGSALVPAFTALGMFVSFWCANNKSSMFASLSLYLIFLLPTQLQGRAQGGFMGMLFQALNPMTGTKHFLATILVNNRSVSEFASFLVSTGVFLVAMLVLLFWYAGPSLRLEAGRATRRPKRFAVAALLILCLYGLGGASTARAFQAAQAPAAGGAQIVDAPLHVSIDMSDTVVRAGTPLAFKTVVANPAREASRPMIVAMNIINLSKTGEVVDPEDWSPQRTQYVEPIAAGHTADLAWRVNCILDGDFMVYIVAIPHPGSPDATSFPVASPGIHVTVTRYTKLNPGGVLPFAIGGPLLLALLIYLVYRHRHRQIDAGGPQ